MKKWMRRKKELEEIEYRPRNVKELLVEMKDTSEFMVDLAFSAIMFDSRDMANEVEDKEYEMDKLLYHIRMGALVAAQNIEDAKQLSGILQVASAAEDISNAAGDIAGLVEAPVEIRPVLPFFLCRANERLVRLVIDEGSSMVRRTIAELGVEVETGVRIIAVRRCRKWFYDPPGGFRFKPADVLVVRGVEESIQELEDYTAGRLGWGEGQPGGGREGEKRGAAKTPEGTCLPPTRLETGEKKFLKMKDITELMLNLSYGALLYNSKSLAGEVYNLEDIVDRLHEKISRHSMQEIAPRSPDRALALIRMADCMETIADAARGIADVVLRDIEPHPVLRASIVESDNSMTMARVSKRSYLTGRCLKELRLGSETGMWVIAIRSGRRWLFDPDTARAFRPSDRIIAVGPRAGAQKLEGLASGEIGSI